jgi:NitT/TauT family transport system substrate-binding protein
MQFNITKFRIVAGLIIAAMLAGCGATASPTPSLDKVSIQLGWTYEFSTSEYYAAEKNGRFADQHLNVDLQQGGFVNGAYVDAITDVVAGKSDFGLSDAFTLSQARADGKSVIAIAAMLQHSPQAIISMPKSNIRRPQDLIGHTVAIADGGARLLFNTLLHAAGIDATKVNLVPRKTYGIDPLVKGDVDAIVGWIINEGVQVKQAGYTPNMILFSDYGVETYTSVLFTTEQTIKAKPDVVQRFVNAAIHGIEDVVSSPSQAIDYTLAYAPKLTRDDQTPRLSAMLPLLAPAGSKPGTMQDDTWKANYQEAVDQSFLSKPLDISTVYTMNFVNQFYKQGS